MFVTTSYHPTAAEHELAGRLAARLSCPLIPRRHSSLPRLKRIHGEQDVLVTTTEGLRFFPTGSGHPFFFHPSTAQIRIKRLLRGESDALAEASGAGPGDTVLDCTAGLGSDAIMFSYLTGPGGSVTALESEPLVALLVEEGMATHESGLAPLDEAMRRIKVVRADHADYLRTLADTSIDVVYFDPMFRVPIKDTSSISPLRTIADDRPLTPESVAEAVRVARRRVVLKEHRDSGEFERLGFRPQYRPYTKIAYGVIDK